MKRRDFITGLGTAAAAWAWPLAARSQQTERVRRIWVLMGLSENDPEAQTRIAALQQGLRKLGWTDGRNLAVEYRWGMGEGPRTHEIAAEVAIHKPDAILVNSPPALKALQQATRTLPIVFVHVADPVSDGFVASLARPGGNITGFTILEHTMSGKWLEGLKEIAPRTTRVAFLQNPEHPSWPRYVRAIEDATPAFGLSVIPAPVRNEADLERAVGEFAREPNGGLVVLPDTFNTVHRNQIIALAARHRLPAIYPNRFFVTGGGLMAYGGDLTDLLRSAASYVDRILKGANPAELPVQQATKFELVINLKTAKALGLEVPAKLLAIADEVIE